jgi:hypothetical protein
LKGGGLKRRKRTKSKKILEKFALLYCTKKFISKKKRKRMEA